MSLLVNELVLQPGEELDQCRTIPDVAVPHAIELRLIFDSFGVTNGASDILGVLGSAQQPSMDFQGLGGEGDHRRAVMVVFGSFAPIPERVSYVPQAYADVARRIYDEAGLPRTIRTATPRDEQALAAQTSFTLTLSSVLRVDTIPTVSSAKGAAITPVTVQPHGGTPGYTFTATGLPAGLGIDGNGVISGTPDPADSLAGYPVTVTVSDGVASDTTTTSFTLTVSTQLRLDPLADVSLGKGTALQPVQLQAHGGTAPYTYRWLNGTAPAGTWI